MDRARVSLNLILFLFIFPFYLIKQEPRNKQMGGSKDAMITQTHTHTHTPNVLLYLRADSASAGCDVVDDVDEGDDEEAGGVSFVAVSRSRRVRAATPRCSGGALLRS